MPVKSDLIATLEAEMDRAAELGEFEKAAVLRDRIDTLKAGEGSYLRKQQPGAMGLGTSQEVPLRPKGWVAPPKPDLMTSRRK